MIARERLPAFERVLWRACRGNVFVRQAEIEDPLEDPASVSRGGGRAGRGEGGRRRGYITCIPLLLSRFQGNQVYKVVFILFFQGDQLRTRVRKICEGWVELLLYFLCSCLAHVLCWAGCQMAGIIPE